MHDIQIHPDSDIIEWGLCFPEYAYWAHFIIADKVSFLTDKMPTIAPNGGISIDRAKIHVIKGMPLPPGNHVFKTQEIHIRPGQTPLNHIYESLGINNECK